MQSSRRFVARWRAAIPCLVAGIVAGCATRHPEALAPVAPVAASIIWRIEPGDVLRSRVFRNPELDAEPTVSPNGTAFFPGLGRIAVAGISLDSLEAMLNARYATLVREPAVQVTMNRDITLYGQIRSPGVYAADPGMTMLALVAKAGGQTSSGASSEVILETSDGRQLLLPREARLGTLDVHRGDAVRFADQSFFLRNATTIGASSLVITTLSTLIGLVLLVSR